MKIALDYDKTFTLDPSAWLRFVYQFRDAGHEIRIVTIRDDRFDRTAALVDIEASIGVIYTRGVAKRWFCQHFGGGFVPDVWIDDKPESVLGNSTTTPEDLSLWRESRGEGEHLPREVPLP